jgi:hypothetical protein
MMSFDLYPPVLIYICISLIQIILDLMKGLYNTSLMKLIVVVMVSFLLHVLCMNDLCIISWIIVFIPFILMSIITTMLLYIFGLNIAYGISNNTTTILNTPTISNTIYSNVSQPPLHFSSGYEYKS